jgi:hypothetical protein
MLELLLMHVTIFLTIGQTWLASIQSSRRGRPKTAIEGSLLPRVCRRWEALATAAPLLLPHAKEASSDDSVEMWVVAPPPTCLVAPPPTHLEEALSNSSSSASSVYNGECPHIKEVSSYELLLDFNYLV